MIRTALSAALVLTLAACSEKKAAETPAAGSAAPSPNAPATAAPGAGEQREPVVAAPAGPTGGVEGEVRFTGPVPEATALQRSSDPVCAKKQFNDEQLVVKGEKIQNVVVRVVDKVPGTGAPPATPVILDQLDCMYRPRVQGAVRGQAVMIKNSDGTLHNVHSYEGTKTGFNLAQPPRANPIEKKLQAASDVVKMKCDVHPWMTGYVVLSDHPFFATTGEEGKFSIQGLPAGKYTLEAWHESLGTKKAEAVITAHGVTQVRFDYALDDKG